MARAPKKSKTRNALVELSPKPAPGNCVHYVTGGEHRKAYVMQVDAKGGLLLLVPQHFPPVSTKPGIQFDATAKKDGTWHWPEKR